MRYWGPRIAISGEWICADLEKKDPQDFRRNPNTARYEEETQAVLRDIARNPVGNALLTAFDESAAIVTIRPVTTSTTRAVSEAISPNKANRAIPPFMQGEDTGQGSDSTVWFEQSRWSQPVNGHIFPARDVLFHELVHSLRHVRKKWRLTKRPDGWDDSEEFVATMLTNIYSSRDNRNRDMRADHSSLFKPLTQTDSAFYKAYEGEVQGFRLAMSDLAADIAAVPNCWNPVLVAWQNFANWSARLPQR